MTIVDRAPAPSDLAADNRVAVLREATSPICLIPQRRRDALAGADVIFHLAAAVSAECEADFDLGMRANLLATERLLARCRELETNPIVVFASSVAVFGASVEHPLPAVVDDHTMPNPQSSYGVQKVIGEQLLADYTRKGFVRGRTNAADDRQRPPRTTQRRRVELPVRRSSGNRSPAIAPSARSARPTEVALASPARAISGLLCAATSSDQAWGGRTAVNLPALTVTVAEMTAALERAAGPAASSLIDWIPDPAVAAIITSWPARFRSERAARLGLAPDPDFDSVIKMHIAESRL